MVALANMGTSGNGGDHFHLARMFNCSGNVAILIFRVKKIILISLTGKIYYRRKYPKLDHACNLCVGRY